MELVFMHGWGFDARFWDPLCALLPEFAQRRIDLGFYGNLSPLEDFSEDSILIGHSFGFVHGIMQKKGWKGWIAINSFPRFVNEDKKTGCVTPGQLREIKFGLAFAGAMALDRFYGLIGATAPQGEPDIDRLRGGLDELRDGDVLDFPDALKIPGLVLASSNDPLVPVAASEDLARADMSDVVWHETAGHILPVADPMWCAERIRDFMEKHSLG